MEEHENEIIGRKKWEKHTRRITKERKWMQCGESKEKV